MSRCAPPEVVRCNCITCSENRVSSPAVARVEDCSMKAPALPMSGIEHHGWQVSVICVPEVGPPVTAEMCADPFYAESITRSVP